MGFCCKKKKKMLHISYINAPGGLSSSRNFVLFVVIASVETLYFRVDVANKFGFI